MRVEYVMPFSGRGLSGWYVVREDGTKVAGPFVDAASADRFLREKRPDDPRSSR